MESGRSLRFACLHQWRPEFFVEPLSKNSFSINVFGMDDMEKCIKTVLSIPYMWIGFETEW